MQLMLITLKPKQQDGTGQRLAGSPNGHVNQQIYVFLVCLLVKNKATIMEYEPPTPPATISTDIINSLNKTSTETLREISRYADALAEHKEREARLEENNDESAERPDNLPDDVPAKATITIKEINDNRYYYYQWREGDTVKSKYKSPVDPDD